LISARQAERGGYNDHVLAQTLEQAAAKKTQPTGSGGLAHVITFSA